MKAIQSNITKLDVTAIVNIAGHDFYVSANGVWLTDFMPTPFIQFAS